MPKCFFTGVETSQIVTLEEIALEDLAEPIHGPDGQTVYSEWVKTSAILTCYISDKLYASMFRYGDKILRTGAERMASWQIKEVA